MQMLQDKFIYNVIFIMDYVKELIKNSDYETCLVRGKRINEI